MEKKKEKNLHCLFFFQFCTEKKILNFKKMFYRKKVNWRFGKKCLTEFAKDYLKKRKKKKSGLNKYIMAKEKIMRYE